MALSEALEKEHKDKLNRIREEISSIEDDIHDVVERIKANELDLAISDMHEIVDNMQNNIRALINMRNIQMELGNYIPPS